MPQFFYDGNLNNSKNIVFPEDESNHLKVFRVKKGERIKVFDLYGNQYYAVVKEFLSGRVAAELIEKIKSCEKNFFISLYFPFIERNSFEEIIRKGCEIGVNEFTPIITEYTQRNFVFDINLKKQRYRAILISAVKQCERADIPVLNESKKFEEIFDKSMENIVVLSRYNSDGSLALPIKKVLNNNIDYIKIVVGPEGGFSKRELELAEKKAKIARIGNFVMRTPTAAQSACAIIRAIKDEDIL